MTGLPPDYSTCPSIPGGLTEETESLYLSFIWVFNTLQIVGLVSITALTLIVRFSSSIKRALTWYIFMIGWIVWCISYFLLAGQQTGDCPAFGFCLFQAALVYAGPPANACACLAILLQLYFSMDSAPNKIPSHPWKVKLLFAAPPVVFALVFIEILVYGLLHPDQVQRDTTGMFCGISNGLPTRISAALVAIFSLVMLFYEVRTFTALYRNWSLFRRLQITKESTGVSVALIVRVSIFSFLPILALGISVASAVLTTSSTMAHLVTASLPSAAVIIFGTQQDILSALRFWKGWGNHKTPVKTYADKAVSAYIEFPDKDAMV
jgi:hypothetical protein